jgi:hypothetical protein
VGIVLIAIGGVALVAGALWLMIRSDLVNRQRVERRREAWEREGGVGPPPGDYLGRGSSSIN